MIVSCVKLTFNFTTTTKANLKKKSKRTKIPRRKYDSYSTNCFLLHIFFKITLYSIPFPVFQLYFILCVHSFVRSLVRWIFFFYHSLVYMCVCVVRFDVKPQRGLNWASGKKVFKIDINDTKKNNAKNGKANSCIEMKKKIVFFFSKITFSLLVKWNANTDLKITPALAYKRYKHILIELSPTHEKKILTILMLWCKNTKAKRKLPKKRRN